MRTSKNRKIFSANNEQGTRIFMIHNWSSFCMQDTFARATHSAKRARDDRVSCIQVFIIPVYLRTITLSKSLVIVQL